MFFYAVTILFALQILPGIFSENCTSHDNGGCSQLCTNLTDSYFCHCRTGYLLEPDNRTCVNDNECRRFGACSHFCVNQEGGYKCSCREDDYIPDPRNNTRCITRERDPILLVYKQYSISKISLEKSTRTELIPRCKSGFSFHFKTGMLFWRDRSGQIFKSPVSRGEAIPVGDLNMRYGEWIIDWIHHNIYYWDKTDFLRQTLKVADFEGKMEKTLINKHLSGRYQSEHASTMALDPEEGWIFWIKGAFYDSEIERVGMDGTRRNIIISNVYEVRDATAITLDLVLKRVFWSKTVKGIFSSDYDGSNILFSVPFSEDVVEAESLTIFEDWIYFTDHREGVHKANKFTGELDASSPIIEPKTSYLEYTTNSVIQIYHPTAQPDGINNCPNANCSHLCLGSFRISKNETYSVKCACPDSLRLGADQATCFDENNQAVLGRNDFKDGNGTVQIADLPDSVDTSLKINGTNNREILQAENLTNSSSATP